jgi:hypothetical protein
MRARRATLLTVTASLLFDVGCHRVVRPPETVPSTSLRTGGGIQRAAEALAIVERREIDTRTLTATFKIVLRRADGSEEASRGAVVVARPDRLRLQIFSFGVMTAYDFTASGDRFRVRTPVAGGERVGRFGAAAADPQNAFGDDLRPLFLGGGATGRAKAADAGDRFVVSVPEADGRRDVEVSKRDGRIVRETLASDAGTALVIEYSDYREVDGAALPFAVTVTIPAKRLALTIEIARYTRNQPVDPKLFEF